MAWKMLWKVSQQPKFNELMDSLIQTYPSAMVERHMLPKHTKSTETGSVVDVMVAPLDPWKLKDASECVQEVRVRTWRRKRIAFRRPVMTQDEAANVHPLKVFPSTISPTLTSNTRTLCLHHYKNVRRTLIPHMSGTAAFWLIIPPIPSTHGQEMGSAP